MLGTAPFVIEDLIAKVWFVSCAAGGLAFIAIGARAGGLALLGAVIGAIVGLGLVASDFDMLPQGAMVGATIGTFVGGLVGLAWRPSASAVVLRALGWVTILVGALSVLAGRVGAQRTCSARRASCLPEIDGGSLALFALDAAWVAAVCFIQAARSKPANAIERTPIVADSPSG